MESPEELKRRKAKERKQAQRERERQHKKEVGAKTFRFEMYRGTREALDRIQSFGEFEETAEVITLLIHSADQLIKRDPSQLKELLNVMRHSKESKND